MHWNNQWLTAFLLRIHNKCNRISFKGRQTKWIRKIIMRPRRHLNNNGKCCVGLNFGSTLPCLPLLEHPWARAHSHLGRGDTKQRWGTAAWLCAQRASGALRRKCLRYLTHLLLWLRRGCSGFFAPSANRDQDAG